jgi:hypothetical protein
MGVTRDAEVCLGRSRVNGSRRQGGRITKTHMSEHEEEGGWGGDGACGGHRGKGTSHRTHRTHGGGPGHARGVAHAFEGWMMRRTACDTPRTRSASCTVRMCTLRYLALDSLFPQWGHLTDPTPPPDEDEDADEEEEGSTPPPHTSSSSSSSSSTQNDRSLEEADSDPSTVAQGSTTNRRRTDPFGILTTTPPCPIRFHFELLLLPSGREASNSAANAAGSNSPSSSKSAALLSHRGTFRCSHASRALASRSHADSETPSAS